MLHTLKKKIAKAYTAIATAIVVAVLFVLQFVIINGNLYFWRELSFWTDLAVMVAILIIANEIYWKNGSARGELNDKYINSAVEYSVRVNRIKTHEPCLTEDFYQYVDEKNIELYIEGRNTFLEKNRISKSDYYYGVLVGETYTTPHCELTKEQLRSLTKTNLEGKPIPYYTKAQVNAILDAVQGRFDYEVLSSTEILSGLKVSKKKYATSYDSKLNKQNYARSNMLLTIVIASIGALFGGDLIENGWSISALFVFLYRILMLAWRAITSDEAGYYDIVDTKRGINVNRSNILTVYATARGYADLFKDINIEIAQVKKQYIQTELAMEGKPNGSE
jgi:hypothetical protein